MIYHSKHFSSSIDDGFTYKCHGLFHNMHLFKKAIETKNLTWNTICIDMNNVTKPKMSINYQERNAILYLYFYINIGFSRIAYTSNSSI